MKRFFYILICILFSVNGYVFSQTNDLTQEDKDAFKERVGVMIDAFQNGLTIICNKDKDEATKLSYKETILKLFMGEGKEFDENGIKKTVTVEVSSIRSGIQTKRQKFISIYLDNLARLPYAKVTIESADTYRISDWSQDGDKWIATATIFQKFCGYIKSGDKIIKRYCDVTKKTIKIYLFKTTDYWGGTWIVKLGDITVDDTTKM